MHAIVESPRGMALGVALIAIVLIGTLIAGSFFVANQDYRVQSNGQFEEAALSAADFGLNRTLQAWNKDTVAAMAIGAVRTRQDMIMPGVTATTRTTRLRGNMFAVVSEGRAGAGLGTNARHRLGLTLYLPIPTVQAVGALTTRQGSLGQSLNLVGTATASGVDASPTGWPCPRADTSVAGFALPDTTRISTTSGVQPTGSPPILQTAVADSASTYFDFGALTFDSLTTMANLVYPASSNVSSVAPSTPGSVCDQTSTRNWGEPWRPPTAGTVTECQSYFPIIWAQGNLQFASGRGQGVLLVSGDLTAAGGAEFTGLIIVKGAVTTSGGGIKAQGAVLAYNQNNAKQAMSGSTQIQFSRCALNTVLAQVALKTPRPVKYHAWVELP